MSLLKPSIKSDRSCIRDAVGSRLTIFVGSSCFPLMRSIFVVIAALKAGKTFEDIEPLIAQYEYNWVAAHFNLSDKATLIAEGEKAEVEWNASLDEDGERDVQACNIDL